VAVVALQVASRVVTDATGSPLPRSFGLGRAALKVVAGLILTTVVVLAFTISSVVVVIEVANVALLEAAPLKVPFPNSPAPPGSHGAAIVSIARTELGMPMSGAAQVPRRASTAPGWCNGSTPRLESASHARLKTSTMRRFVSPQTSFNSAIPSTSRTPTLE